MQAVHKSFRGYVASGTFEYGPPPRPSTPLSKVQSPYTMLQAGYSVSQCLGICVMKMESQVIGRIPTADGVLSNSRVRGAVPMPVESATDTSSAPISRSDVVISATFEGETLGPSKGQ